MVRSNGHRAHRGRRHEREGAIPTHGAASIALVVAVVATAGCGRAGDRDRLAQNLTPPDAASWDGVASDGATGDAATWETGNWDAATSQTGALDQGAIADGAFVEDGVDGAGSIGDGLDGSVDGGGIIDDSAVDGSAHPAAGVSTSKLGIHVLRTCNDCVRELVEPCPRVMKFLAGEGMDCLHAYRSRCGPDATVVLRVYVSSAVRYGIGDDPEVSALDYWHRMTPALASVDPADIDWLEGPNELDNLPDWYHDPSSAQWVAEFWSHLADAMNSAGYAPLVGAIAVGNPAMNGEPPSGINLMRPLAQVIRDKSYRIGWSYHAYTVDPRPSARASEPYFTLRYRRIRAEVGLHGVPIVLTEGGQDSPGGWLDRGTASTTYLAWLAWLDHELRDDPDVVGITLFQAGGAPDRWNGFDICPISTELASLIATAAP